MVKTVVKRIPLETVAALEKIDPNISEALRVLLKERKNHAQLTLESIKSAAKEGCAEAIVEAKRG